MEKVNDVKIIENLINYDKIATLNAVNMMENEKQWDLYVDDAKYPKGFILKCGYWNIPYSPYDDVAYKMLKEIDFRESSGFSGVLLKYYEIVKSLKEIDWTEKCYTYYLDSKDLDLNKIKHNVRSLRIEDAQMVNQYYTYKSEDSLDYIKSCISNRPSSAVFDSDNNPISWAVLREDGTMGIMYTLKEYRKMGLAVSVSIDLAKKVIDGGKIPFVHIVTENEPSIKLAESIGFKKYGEIMWFGVK